MRYGVLPKRRCLGAAHQYQPPVVELCTTHLQPGLLMCQHYIVCRLQRRAVTSISEQASLTHSQQH